MNMNFTFFSDAGHGWLKVPLELIKELGIENNISSCSYMCARYVYLEEDLDAVTFDTAMKNSGKSYKIVERYSNLSKIRSYAPYNSKLAGGIKDKSTVKLFNGDTARVQYLAGARYVHLHCADRVYKATKQLLCNYVAEVITV